MELFNYSDTQKQTAIYSQIPDSELIITNGNKSPHKLIWGENTLALKNLIEKQGLAGKVDLVYIDPPFATNQVFTFSEERTSTISSSKQDKIAYSDKFTLPAFLDFLGEIPT